MILAAAFALGLATVPLFGGRLARLATIPLRRRWTILAALAIQVVIISVIPRTLPGEVAAAVHLASYALTLVFIVANWRVPGIAVLVAGGLANLVAIGANGGVMPASQRALEISGRVAPEDAFMNSRPQDGAHLLILGDIFALPAGIPLANVFSVGDVLLVVGGVIVVHKAAGSHLPGRRRRGAADDPVPVPALAWGDIEEPPAPQPGSAPHTT